MRNEDDRERSSEKGLGGTPEEARTGRPLSDQVELEVELLRPRDRSPGRLRSPSETATRTTPRVLVVDDDGDLRAYVGRSLEHVGIRRHGVLEAGCAEDALAVLAENRVDLVITDVVLPTIDGFALTRTIRADAALDEVPILLITGEASHRETGERARAAGAQAVLIKPFNARKLAEVVGRLIGPRPPPGDDD